jgi:ABC-type uncharacterized transport system auxiliary subunit
MRNPPLNRTVGLRCRAACTAPPRRRRSDPLPKTRSWAASRWNKGLSRIVRCAFSLLAVLALAGCISLPGADKNKPQPSIYTLHPRPPQIQQSSAPGGAPVVVFVPRPELPKGFDTERITLLFEQSHRLDYYANAKWSARLDDLLQDFIVQTVRHVLPGPIAATTDAAAAAHHKLVVKITAFQPVYQITADSPPRRSSPVRVKLSKPSSACKKAPPPQPIR